jgi:hypothetical protein
MKVLVDSSNIDFLICSVAYMEKLEIFTKDIIFRNLCIEILCQHMDIPENPQLFSTL